MIYSLTELRKKNIIELLRLREITNDLLMKEKIRDVINEKLDEGLPQPQSVKYRDNKNRKRITYI
jgi:hypothetical protein